MSQIISAIPANALLPVAGALVGWVGHMAWHHAERAHVARGMALIRRFMDGNDGWLDRQRTEFEAAAALPAPWEQADPDVTGEVLHVEHVTGEHQLPSIAEGLARLADEVGLAQALSEPCCTGHGDEPCAPDSGLVPPYCCGECPNRGAVLALSDEPEHDDEDAPADDTDRPGLWLVLLAIPVALWDRAREWWRSLWAKPEPYRGRHWVAGTQHTGQYPIVPAQRDGGEN